MDVSLRADGEDFREVFSDGFRSLGKGNAVLHKELCWVLRQWSREVLTPEMNLVTQRLECCM